MSDGLVEPVSIERSEIASNLNSFVLYSFLMGIYAIVYFGTLCTYLTSKINHCRIVISTITALYLLGIFELGVRWYVINWQFIKYGDTRDGVYASYSEIPAWSSFMIAFCPSVSIVLADGLLLWRCFHVWNGSIRVMVLPSFLLFLEIGSFVAAIVLKGLSNHGSSILSEQQVAMDNAVIATQTFLSVAASLVTTFLIVFRIHSMSKENGGSGQRFKHILDIVVQSAAVYSLAILGEAIKFGLPETRDIDNSRVFAFGLWMDSLTSVISGMVPTIMVARIILTSPNTTHVSTFQLNMSGLQFGCSTIETRENGIANFDIMAIRRHSSSIFEDKKDMV